jgi:hypothetical protein
MSRLRIGLASVLFVASGLVSVVLASGGVANAAPSNLGPCVGDLTGTTFTLTAACSTTAPINVPSTITTIVGAGFAITASDVMPGSFNGAVLNSTGATMNVQDLMIQGQFSFGGCNGRLLFGIQFNNASGTVNNVTVTGISEVSGCVIGRAIAAASTTPQTVTITNTTVSDYSRNGIQASGPTTLNVSASTVGPPTSLPAGSQSQNGLFYNAGATGTVTDNVIYGNGFAKNTNASTAILMTGATGVTVMGNTITGAGTDIGVAVFTNSSGIVINANQIGRTAPDSPDTFGIGVQVESGSTATVTCNSFSGWITNLVGVAPQPVCITTNTLPDGTVSVPYSATLVSVGGTAPYTYSLVSGSLPPGLTLSPSGMITGTPTSSGTFTFTIKVTDSVGGTATEVFTVTVAGRGQGYWLGATEGGVFAFGVAAFHGSSANMHLNAPVVGIARTPAGGYWLVGSDGGVFSFGAPFFGSLGGGPILAPIVGIASTPEGDGYYLVGANGSVFPFGKAVFHGSMEGKHLNKPIVSIGVTPDNGGYYLVAADGGVFTFGDAVFHGSMGGKPLNKPVVGMAVDDTTLGYWLAASDGGVFSFDAPFLGSMGGLPLNAPVVGMAAGADDLGYRLTASDGGVFCFGTALFFGSMGGMHLNGPVMGIASIGP